MVNITTIRESNTRFVKQHHEGRVCVFAGATSGIGFATLEKMASSMHSSTFYVLGRTPERYQNLLDELRQLASSDKVVYIETQVSLISSIDAACAQITSAEKKVDYLCMSPGGMPFQGAVYTDEGLETYFAVSYYSKLRLVSNLLPLLNHSIQPRVLSILNGTKETKFNEDDIGLENKWRILAVVAHTTLLTSLAFDHLAANDVQKHISFIHGTPGFVNSGRGGIVCPSRKDGLFWWAIISLFQKLSSWIIRNFGMVVKNMGRDMRTFSQAIQSIPAFGLLEDSATLSLITASSKNIKNADGERRFGILLSACGSRLWSGAPHHELVICTKFRWALVPLEK